MYERVAEFSGSGRRRAAGPERDALPADWGLQKPCSRWQRFLIATTGALRPPVAQIWAILPWGYGEYNLIAMVTLSWLFISVFVMRCGRLVFANTSSQKTALNGDSNLEVPMPFRHSFTASGPRLLFFRAVGPCGRAQRGGDDGDPTDPERPLRHERALMNVTERVRELASGDQPFLVHNDTFWHRPDQGRVKTSAHSMPATPGGKTRTFNYREDAVVDGR